MVDRELFARQAAAIGTRRGALGLLLTGVPFGAVPAPRGAALRHPGESHQGDVTLNDGIKPRFKRG